MKKLFAQEFLFFLKLARIHAIYIDINISRIYLRFASAPILDRCKEKDNILMHDLMII
jgi:hypothetical protein